MFDQLRKLWQEIGNNQRISLLLAGVGIVVICVALMVWSGRPKLQLLYGGLDPKEMSEIANTVDSLGVNYEIRNGGNSIYVESDQVYTVRMQLASSGIPSGGGVGYEIFDSGSFGISSFVQHTNFVRAIQGELSRTINQLNGVRSSKVMIVIPENELLISGTEKKPTASVFVDTGGRTLPLEAVDSIRSLVSNAVEGMNPNDVAVVDNRGNVLSAGLKDDGTMGMTSSQIKFRKGMEDYYAQKVETMLGRVVGQENVVVRVSVGVNMDMQTLVEEQYDPDTTVVRQENTTEDKVISSETKNNNVVGEEANVAGGNQASGGEGLVSNSDETKTVKDTTYEISRTTIETVRNPGEIQDLTAAVFLALPFIDNGQGVLEPQPRSEEQMNRIRMMVVNALGVNYEDEEELDRKITIEEMEFQQSAGIAGEIGGGESFSLPMIFDGARTILAVVISIVMLLFFFRMIRNAASSSDRMEILPPESFEGRDGGSAGNGAGAGGGGGNDIAPSISPELLNELIKQNPDKVSSALKNWAFPDN